MTFERMTKTRKNSKRNKREIPARQDPKEVVTDNEKSMDLGGIPLRDLKKNLGCG